MLSDGVRWCAPIGGPHLGAVANIEVEASGDKRSMPAKPATAPQMRTTTESEMITQETAAMIRNAYREIEAAEKLLADMEKESKSIDHDKHAPSLKDAFGRKRHLQLGIPSGENGHRLLNVQPTLAESVIRAHIEHKRAELMEVNERARVELLGGA